MFKNKIFLAILFVAAMGCSKSETTTPSSPPPPPPPPPPPVNTDTFTTYLIKAGKNYCENNSYPMQTVKAIKFKAFFDSSCIYTNVDPNNQADINKLYGFADSNSFHQINSARFGWNWMNGKMHIHAYCYVSTVRMYKELGVVELNKEIDCSLEVLPGKYIFTLNGKRDTMLRASQDTVAKGYKLLPYFGGDEPAPHDVRIKIKEVK